VSFVTRWLNQEESHGIDRADKSAAQHNPTGEAMNSALAIRVCNNCVNHDPSPPQILWRSNKNSLNQVQRRGQLIRQKTGKGDAMGVGLYGL
jgi:hypothetical protein